MISARAKFLRRQRPVAPAGEFVVEAGTGFVSVQLEIIFGAGGERPGHRACVTTVRPVIEAG